MTTNNEFFCLSKDALYVLYGAASIGSIFCDRLQETGYNVLGFIDKRAKEIKKLNNLPVYDIENNVLDRNVVVIISVKNVFEHSKIANQLIDNGYYNLLFRPYNCVMGRGTDQEKIINKSYDVVEDKSLLAEGKIIEIPRSITKSGIALENKAVLSENKDELTVLIPYTILYTDKKVKMNGEMAVDMPISFLLPHIKFAECVLGIGQSTPELYVKYCEEAARSINRFEITDAWRRNVVKNRTEVFVNMNRFFDLHYEFFIEKAPYVRWNKSGYFNLCSGKHRSIFLCVKGKNYLPVKMSREDYNIWSKVDMQKWIEENLTSHNIFECNGPVEIPYMFDFPCNNEQFLFQLLRVCSKKIAEILYTNSDINPIREKHVYLNLEDSGFLARFFERSGSMVYDAQSNNPQNELINVFLQVDSKDVAKREKYDIAIVEKKRKTKEIDAGILFEIVHEVQDENCLFTGIYKGVTVFVYLKVNDNL